MRVLTRNVGLFSTSSQVVWSLYVYVNLLQTRVFSASGLHVCAVSFLSVEVQ